MASVPVRSKVANLQGLFDIASDELQRLGTDIILPMKDGYQVFRDYWLCQHKGSWHLSKRGSAVAEFTTSRTALAWCIADKHQEWQLCQRIRQLDERIAITDRGLEPRLRRWRAGTGNTALVAKIQHRQQQRYTAKAELDKCVSRAKYLQIRGLRNDTQRNKQS